MGKKIDEQQLRSRRRYPAKDCINPNCEYDKVFVPHDARQQFCGVQCRTNFFNDKRRIDAQGKYGDEKKLRSIDKVLARMYSKGVDIKGYCCLNICYFKYEQLDISLLVRKEINTETSRLINWYFEYGIEMHPNNSNYIIIHKRS